MNTEVKYAGFWVRAFALLIDGIILTIVFSLLDILFGNVPMRELINILIATVYITYFTASPYQATLGKQLLKLKVCSSQFERLSMGKAFLRYALPVLVFYALATIVLMMSIDIAVSVGDKTMESIEVSNLEKGTKTLQLVGLNILILVTGIVWYGMSGWSEQKTALHDKILKTRVIYKKTPNLFFSDKPMVV